MESAPHAASPSSAPVRRRRSARRWLAGLLVVVLLLPLAGAALLYLAAQSEAGTRLLWRAATGVSRGRLSGTLDGGTLAHGLHLRALTLDDAKTRVSVDRLDGAWRLDWSPLALTVDYLRAGTVDVRLPAAPSSAPISLPQQLRLPLAVTLKELSLRALTLHKDVFEIALNDLLLSAGSDRDGHRLVLKKLGTPYGTASADLRLGTARPFALSGSFALAGVYQREHYQAGARLSGTLEALAIDLDAGGDKLNGSAHIDATPFAPVPLRRAQLWFRHVNPKMFAAAAPQADIDVRATLGPAADAGSALAVSGSMTLANAQAGPLDQDRLPLISASADLRFDPKVQQLSNFKMKLPNGAGIDGQGAMRSDRSGEFAFEASALDLHALHGKLKGSRLQGPIKLSLQPGRQQVSVNLSDPHFTVQAELAIDAAELRLQSGRLSAGATQLALAGTLTRDAQSNFALRGKLGDFNPAAWADMRPAARGKGARKSAGKAISARINADFEASGALAPERQVRLKFRVHDSVYDGLPMTGGGVIALAGRRLLASDVTLAAAGNRLLLKGGFGAAADRLTVKLDAPALERLGFGLGGSLRLDGQISGTLAQPNLHATYRAEQLVLGAHRLAHLEGHADVQAPAGAGAIDPAKVRVAVDVDAQGYQGPALALAKLSAQLRGSYADHTLHAAADGVLRGKPVALTLAAQGRLSRRKDGFGWDGTVQTFGNTQAPRFALNAPMALSVAPGKLVLGATRATLENAAIDLKSFSYLDGSIRSQGSAGALDVGRLLGVWRAFGGASVPIKTDLVLDARWNFALGDAGSGFAEIERRRGDLIVSGNQGDVALGLTELRLRADLQAKRINLDARAAASRIGTLAAQGSLQQTGPRALPSSDSVLSGHAGIAMPQLRAAGALWGPQVLLDGALNMDLIASGTLGQPKLSGTIAGDRLALNLFDSGIRLQDGTVRIALSENLIELRQIEFHGGEGTLRASGKVLLDQSNPELSANLNATVIADRLQLFASPQHQLTVSGQARIANVDRQLRLDGKVRVDRGLFDLPKSGAPRLGDDVVIVQPGGKTQSTAGKPQDKLAQATEKPAGGFSPHVDIEVDLGDDFRFRGADADLLLRGSMHVKSEPYLPIQASGTISVADGTYEVFGRKLAIETGLINFTGPLDNPSVNILAMRRNQEVEAGVQVTGYARQVRVKLVSEPNVADEEKLSWLLFGHGSASSGLGQQQAAGAALALLNNSGGKRLAQGFGLDTFSIGASESGLNDQQVVHLGKAVSERFYVGYEQSLAGAASIVKFTWQFSRNWSAVVRAGAVNSLDALFTRRFD